jgi:hypothetical protein
MCYQVSLVLLESDEAPRMPLPVQARVVRVMPFRQPVIESVTNAAGPFDAILPGTELVIRGRQLQGDQTFLRIAGVRVIPTFVSPTEIRVALAEPPFLAGELRAGAQGAQVAHQMIFGLPDDPAALSPADPHEGLESNVAAFVLHPVITGPVQAQNAQNDLNNTRRGELRVDVTPSVGPKQRVMLVLNGTDAVAAAAYSFPAPERTADTSTLTVPFARVRPGAYFVRAQVDGAESLLDQDLDPANPAFTGPQVNIP